MLNEIANGSLSESIIVTVLYRPYGRKLQLYSCAIINFLVTTTLVSSLKIVDIDCGCTLVKAWSTLEEGND